MRTTAFAAVLALGTPLDTTAPALDLAAIERINRANLGWTAGVNTRFANKTIADAQRLLGVRRDPVAHAAAKAKLSTWDLTPLPASAIPASFDTVTNWPSCANITGHIRDQSDCGSCWAVSSSETINDRFCIVHNYTGLLSEADTTSCCNFNNGCSGSQGCDGGFIEDAWNYYTSVGIVTGGDYVDVGAGTTCFPYPLPDCAHHEPNPHYPSCSSTEYPTPACPTECTEAKYPTKWKADKHFAKTAYNVNGIAATQTELMARGSITVTFTVYQDFLTYKSGVYVYDGSSPELGGHAVKLVGWGTLGGVDYWRIANSWNQYWGDNGFFLIRRGTDECGIEDDLAAGTV